MYKRQAQGRVDGTIVVDPRDDDPRPSKLNEYGLPTVVIGQKFDECGAVIGDDVQMVRLLALHLAEQLSLIHISSDKKTYQGGTFLP